MIQDALDAGSARNGVPLHDHRTIIGRFEMLWRHHLLGAAERLNPPTGQEQKPVAVLGCQVEIMRDENRCPPTFSVAANDNSSR